jgi:phosphatidylglycerol:prolipoprotein diacylglycerol transferase
MHWYGLMYLVAFLAAWGLATVRARQHPEAWSSQAVADLIFYAALGVILGGRIGYMLFYNLSALWQHPLTLFKVWQGGMSFHGGFLGVLIALGWFCHTYKKSFFEVTDFVAPLVPLGLGAGRMGNFINGELWGRVTAVPWGMVFPNAGPLPRHPSQLYECFLEGMVLFFVLWFYSAKPRPRLAVSALFLIGYGAFRTFVECFRQPDSPIGFVAFGWLTMGQLLSIPMVILGCFLMWYAYRYPVYSHK